MRFQVFAALSSFIVSVVAAGQQDATARFWTLLDRVPDVERAQEAWIRPDVFQPAALDLAGLVEVLKTAPREFTREGDTGPLTVSLPYPDGSVQQFAVVESPVMEEGLAAQFPEIRTFRGQGLHDTNASVRLDFTPQGFHAMVRSPFGDVFIDPYSKGNTRLYSVYYKGDYTKRTEGWHCDTPASDVETVLGGTGGYGARNANPLRTYRLACAATGEYTAFHGGTVALGQAAVVTAINRVTGVYETELGIRLTLVANNSALIYTNSGSDPYSNGSGSTMLGQNQTTCTNVIGSANYDIGHVFSTGGGGIAGLGVVCSSTNKARGVTGSPSPNGDPFWIDYVAHEMGHQFGGNHSFNGTTGNCGGGNRNASTSYEPGSGSTIMGYAGICGSDDLQPNSHAYFSFISQQEITTFTTSGGGSSCDGTISTGNTAPTANAGADFTIPFGTPFTLTGSGADANNDPVTYCWEQRDTRSTGFTLAAGDPGQGAIIRSWQPVTIPSRTIPRLSNLLANTFAAGEILPDSARTLNFRLTTRDNRSGAGGFGTDDMVVTVASAGPFQVTSPNTAVSWAGGSQQTVTWSVAGTNAPPVSTASVRILLSTDGGSTFPTTIVASTPNDGSETITVPGVNTSQARIKVEAVNNIYFDISNVNFSITGCSAPVISGQPADRAVCPGNPATFTVGASGTGLGYQWRKNGGTIAGATAGSYTIAAVVGDDAGSYDCVVSGTCGGPVTSSAATLTVNTPPAITGQPTSQTACFGGSVTFTVVAGGSPAPSYQWRKGATNIAGATGPSLTIDPVQVSSAATYSCVVSNSCGSVPSDGAALTVQTAPGVITQPQSQTVCAGSPVTLSVFAGGNPAPTYQWRKGGNALSGQTASSLTIASAATGDIGSYDCVITNACDSTTTDAAVIDVNSPPSFLSQPSGQEGCVGASAVFSVSVSGSPAPTLQWRLNGNALEGQTGTTLTISPITPGSQGAYDCVATNSCTSVPSSAAMLTVKTAPAITAQPQDATAGENATAVFSVGASGSGPLGYQWRHNGAALAEGGAYSGVHTGSLSIVAAAGLEGSYDCLVSNGCGSAPSNAATLTVTTSGCGPADFNGDGDVGTDADIEAFFACLGGNCCPACWPGGADFNGDGDIGTDGDIESFFRVLGGGAC